MRRVSHLPKIVIEFDTHEIRRMTWALVARTRSPIGFSRIAANHAVIPLGY